MGYLLNEDQKDLLQSVKAFMEKEVKPHVAEIDASGRFPRELYEQMFQLGLHCLSIPKAYGGSELDLITELMITEEISKVDAGIADSLGGVGLAFQTLLVAGNDAQKALFADIILPGGFAAYALTEADAGSDAAATRTTAQREGEEYVITGSKSFITNGSVADIYIVFAKTDKQKGAKGISAFLVEAGRPGLSAGKEENKMGIRASNTSEVIFDQVRIPADHLIGEEGRGFQYAMQALDTGRLSVSAMAIGIAQRAMEEAAAYAKTRVTFGQPIANYQAIRFMLADMDMKIEAARQLMVHAATRAMNGQRYTREAAIAKCMSSDMAVEVTTDAIQILGGYGYSREYPVEKLLRDAKIFQIFEGTNQIQRMIISSQLLGS